MTKKEAIDTLKLMRSQVEWEYPMDYSAAIDMAIAALAAQPERKKGHWVPVDSLSAFGGDESAWISRGNPIAFYYCSECKEQAYAGEDGESLLTDFCPDCGADMRGEHNGQ